MVQACNSKVEIDLSQYTRQVKDRSAGTYLRSPGTLESPTDVTSGIDFLVSRFRSSIMEELQQLREMYPTSPITLSPNTKPDFEDVYIPFRVHLEETDDQMRQRILTEQRVATAEEKKKATRLRKLALAAQSLGFELSPVSTTIEGTQHEQPQVF